MEGELKDWSVLVYMAADANDNKLRQAAISNLDQMHQVGSNNSVYVAAQADLPGEPTRRYVFPERKEGETGPDPLVESIPNVDSADPKTVREFFEWGTKACPAKNIFLIFWGHGFGLDDYNPYLPTDSTTTLLPPADVPGAKLSEAAQAAATSRMKYVGDSLMSLIPDATHGSVMLNSQLAAVVRDCKSGLEAPQKLAILGFDCCDMALLEVWFEFSGCAAITVGSQYSVPYKSWPYDVFLRKLLSSNSMGATDVATALVDSYVAFYDALRAKPAVTLSVCSLDIDTGDALLKAIQPLADLLAKASAHPDLRTKIFDARNSSPIFEQDGFIDLEAFCRLLQFNMPGSEIESACDGVIGAARRYVLYKDFAPHGTSGNISLSTGVSVWFPPWIQYPDVQMVAKGQSQSYLRNGYSQTVFAQRTGWDQFLKSILSNTQKKITREARMSEMSDAGSSGMGQVKMGRNSGVFQGSSSREAGVIVRATVEAFGPVGDTELNVTVKWPAGSYAGPIVTTDGSGAPLGSTETISSAGT